jgi:CheY-like chemotaxis protein
VTDTITLLVADDNAGVRFVIGTMSRADGELQLVAEAENGQDAIERARIHQPDVVLLDVSMPVMDGIAALPGIREAAPGTRIVMYSAVSDRRVEALRAGADAWVTKGDSLTELRDAILAAVRDADQM